MRKVIILGSSGSIGQTAIRTIKERNLDIEVAALVAHSSESIIEDATYFECPYLLTKGKRDDEIASFLSSIDADIALNGVAGSDGLFFSDLLIDLGFDLALANKETIVLGGEYILDKAKERGVKIIPVDSEHSAIYHLIKDHFDVDKLIITASGGPFIDREDLSAVTIKEALKHPTWKMGSKITIDSASLANKGLEVIEAGYLFNFAPEDILVTVHRQSIVHSLIRLHNGAYYAQLSRPDMALPIISALSDEKILIKDIVSPLDFTSLTLTFEKWDPLRFRMLSLAYDALKARKGYPIAFNIADEISVNAFLNNRIKFTDIPKITEEVFSHDFLFSISSFEDASEVINRAREISKRVTEKYAI